MLILAKTRHLKSSSYTLAVLALALYACTPSVTLRRLENVEKIPMHAVLLLEQGFEKQEFRGRIVDAYLEGKPVWINLRTHIGPASRELFEKGLGVYFEKVDVVSSEERIPPNSLIFIPQITRADADKVNGLPVATIEYALTVKTSAGENIIISSATATKAYDIGFVPHLGRLIVDLSTLMLLRGADVNEQFANAFALAMESAFEQLMRELQSTGSFTRYVRAETERRTLPSELVTAVSFADRNSLLPNNTLDAGEEGELVATVQNRGRGAAFAVEILISAESPGIRISGRHPVGDIPPGESRSIRVPVLAGLDISSGVADILIDAKEKRGYDGQKVKLVLPTARLEKPSLTIASYEINDGTTGLARGNGNGIPENGETVELLVFVRNNGPGVAVATSLSLSTTDRGIGLVQSEGSLGIIPPNQIARGNLVFSVPRAYTGKAINLGLRVRDGRGEEVASAPREISLPVTTRLPVLAGTTRILSSGREVRELTNGQAAEIEVAPRNTGTLDAAGVTVRVRSNQQGVEFRWDSFEITSLRAGATESPVRFAFDISRVFASDKFNLTVQLSQRDFPGWSQTLDIPVNLRRPVLASSSSVSSRQGRRVIEQGETADLEVRVLNTGNLPAQGVEARIDVSAAGVEVQGPKSVGIGTILPNDQSMVRFRLSVRRSVPVGELPISLAVSQSEFPALTEPLRLEIRPEQAIVQGVPPQAPVPPPSPGRARPPFIALVTPTESQFIQGEYTELRGTIFDEQGVSQIRVSVNGRPVPEATIRQGMRRQPGTARDQVDLSVPIPLAHGRNTIEIIAYNIANEQERVSRTVTRLEDKPRKTDSAPTLVAHADVDRHVLDLTPTQPDRRKWAVIVGIEQYRRAPSVSFASRDAVAFREYAVKLLGVPPEQVYLLLDDQATKTEIQVLIEDRLQNWVRSGDIVYVYYAGHGLTGVQDKTPYLLPADGDPQSLRFSAYAAKDLYGVLGKLKAERVLVFLDACFSGLSARQDPPQMLLTGTRPIIVTVEDAFPLSPNVISFAATDKDQVSNAYKEQAHGLFTYFLLKGLSGAADRKGDGSVLLSALADYVKDQVSRTSRQLFGQNMHQTPVVRPIVDSSRDTVLKGK